MTSLTIMIVTVFVVGYAFIAMESLTRINKAAIALMMLVGCWTLYMCDPSQFVQLMHPDFVATNHQQMMDKITSIIKSTSATPQQHSSSLWEP